MYRIERQPWGFRLRFGGFIPRLQMEAWKAESAEALVGATPGFGVHVDMRDLRPLSADTSQVMVDGQRMYRDAGMSRSVVIVDSAQTALQFKELARESGIYDWERYLSSDDEDAEAIAMAWIRDGVDPDAVIPAPVARESVSE